MPRRRLHITMAAAVLVGSAALAHAEPPAPALFGPDDDGADPHAIDQKVKAELALANRGKPRTIMLAAVATDEWGCDCLPFVYAPFAASAPDRSQPFFFPIAGAGADPGALTAGSSAGSYELTGHFTKQRITERTWRSRRKAKPGGDKKRKQPVFAVDHWCFRKAADAPDAYGPTLDAMKQAGVAFCP